MSWAEIAWIAGFLALLAGALYGVGLVAGRLGLQPETKRKLIHVGLGVSVLLLPLLFHRALPVAVLCVLALGLLWLSRRVKSLGSALHDVERSSLGDVYFAISVAVLFLLADVGARASMVADQIHASPFVFYLLPILIMTLSDTAAALTGTEYGRRVFAVADGRKSWEGVIAFFITSWMAALVFLLLATEVPRDTAILLSMTLAFIGATIEAESWGGLDNLFVPMGLHVLMVALAGASNWDIVLAFVIYGVLTLASIRYAGTYGRQPLRAAILVLTVTWIAFGPVNFLMVAVAMAMTLAANRMRSAPDPKADLQTVFAVVVLAVVWLVVGSLMAKDMILSFSTSVAVYGSVMATIALRHRPVLAFGAVAVIAGMLFLRILMQGLPWEAAALRVGVGGAGLVVVGIVGLNHPAVFGRQRATKATLVALVIAGVSLLLG